MLNEVLEERKKLSQIIEKAKKSSRYFEYSNSQTGNEYHSSMPEPLEYDEIRELWNGRTYDLIYYLNGKIIAVDYEHSHSSVSHNDFITIRRIVPFVPELKIKVETEGRRMTPAEVGYRFETFKKTKIITI